MLILEGYSLPWWAFLPILFVGQIFAAFFLVRCFLWGLKFRFLTHPMQGPRRLAFISVVIALAINLPGFALWAGICAVLLKLRLADEPYWPWLWYPITFLFLFVPTAYLYGDESAYRLDEEQILYHMSCQKLVKEFAYLNQMMLIVCFIVLCFLI